MSTKRSKRRPAKEVGLLLKPLSLALVITSHAMAAGAETSLMIHHEDQCYLPLASANMLLALVFLLKFLVKHCQIHRVLRARRANRAGLSVESRRLVPLCPLALTIAILCYLTKIVAIALLAYARHQWPYFVLLASELSLTGMILLRWWRKAMKHPAIRRSNRKMTAPRPVSATANRKLTASRPIGTALAAADSVETKV